MIQNPIAHTSTTSHCGEAYALPSRPHQWRKKKKMISCCQNNVGLSE